MIIPISKGLAMSTYWKKSITTHSNWVRWPGDTLKREEQTDLLAEKTMEDFSKSAESVANQKISSNKVLNQ